MYKSGTNNLYNNDFMKYQHSKGPARRKGINGIIAMEECKRPITRINRSGSRTRYHDISDDSNDDLYEPFDTSLDPTVSTKYQIVQKINELNQKQYDLRQYNENLRDDIVEVVDDMYSGNQRCERTRPEETSDTILSKQQYTEINDEQLDNITTNRKPIKQIIDERNEVIRKNIADIREQDKIVESQIETTETELNKLTNPVNKIVSLFKSSSKRRAEKQRANILKGQLSKEKLKSTTLKKQLKEYEAELQYNPDILFRTQ